MIRTCPCDPVRTGTYFGLAPRRNQSGKTEWTSRSTKQGDTMVRKLLYDPANSRCLMTIPGFGPIIATAVETMAPPASVFKRGRDFAAWMELTPRQNS
ncbi:MAG TPA: transposase, partial [Hyphomicrobiales bacterium]|nr:transposase [Hyphomicrobiales bacterium]